MEIYACLLSIEYYQKFEAFLTVAMQVLLLISKLKLLQLSNFELIILGFEFSGFLFRSPMFVLCGKL